MMRVVLLVLLVAPTSARGSQPVRRLTPELCEAEQRPANTSLAVPARVRVAVERTALATPGPRDQRARRPRALLAVVAAALLGGALVALAAR